MSTAHPPLASAQDHAGMADVETAVEFFERRANAAQSTVIVFYRGERSFFCKQWLRRWLAIPAIERRLELAGVVILFVSSQSQGKAYSVAAQIAARRPALDDRVFFFGDPEHLLVSHLAHRGFAQPVVTNPDSHRAHGWVFDYGMVQPAVLAIAADGSVLYHWISKPSILNVAGKLDRPDPFDVWDTIERRLDRIRITKARAVRAARAAATRPTQPSATDPPEEASEDFAAVKAQPSLHSLGDVHPAAPPLKNDVREEKSDSQLAAPMSRKTSDRSIIRTRDRQPSTAKVTEPRAQPLKLDQDLPLASGEVTPLLRRNGESENNLAPLSTNIETLNTYALSSERLLSREEPDMSDGDIASIPVKVLSSNINALASEVLAENTLSLGVKRDKAPTSSPGIANRANVERIISGPLTEDFVDEFEGIGDTQIDTDDDEECDADIAPDESSDSEAHSDSDSQSDSESEIDEDKSRFNRSALQSATVENDASRSDEESDDDERNDESLSVDDLDADKFEHEFVGSTNSLRESQAESVVEPPTQRQSSGVFSPTSPSLVPEAKSLETHGNHINDDSIDGKTPSLDSDQVETPMMANRIASIRTDDSCLPNICESPGLHIDREIIEEADDKKTGIADYLRELKGPEKRHYRVRGATAAESVIDKGGISPLPQSFSAVTKDITSADDQTATSLTTETVSAVTVPSNSRRGELTASQFRSEDNEVKKISKDRRQRKNGEHSAKAHIETASIFDTRDNDKRRAPETDSPHPEMQGGVSATVDVSPFADADHNISSLADRAAKGAPVSLQDEYEAYDEYIVCEFEVEEYVEEYDSDTASRSRVFVTAVVDEESHPTGLTSEAKTLSQALPTINGTPRNQSDGQARQDVASGRNERGHVRIAETAPSFISDMGRGVGGNEGRIGAAAFGSVRNALRRINLPIFSVSRLSQGRQPARPPAPNRHNKEAAGQADEELALPESDAAKVSRKETLKSFSRKRGAGTFYGGLGPGRCTAPHREPEDNEAVPPDEHTAKLGRKETLKSVLRKLPVPKTRRRQHTEEGLRGHGGVAQTRSSGHDESGKSNAKRSGLQAVLERLPSLSASGSRSRPAVLIPDVDEAVKSVQGPERRNYVETDAARGADGRESSGRTGVTWGETTVKSERKASREEDGDFVTADGTEDGELDVWQNAEEPRTNEAVAGKRVGWRGPGGEKESSMAGGMGRAQEGRRVRRLSVLRADEEGERLGPKRSVGMGGGRILSRFRMI